MQSTQNQQGRNTPAQHAASQQLAMRIRKQWGELTDQEIACAEHDREQFRDAVNRKYGLPKEEVEKQLRQIEHEFKAA